MEEFERDAQMRTPEVSAPILPENPEAVPFSASVRERIGAFLMYPLAFCYISSILAYYQEWVIWFCVFSVGFLLLGEFLCRGRRRSAESWIWLGCMALILFSILRGQYEAQHLDEPPLHTIESGTAFLLLHAYAVYWALCRADALLAGGSGGQLLLDALDGVVIFPAKHFFLRIRSAFYALTHAKHAEKRPAAARAATVLAIAAAIALLALALRYLSEADAQFRAALAGLLPSLEGAELASMLLRLLLSLPVGAYLFGLLAGSAREDGAALRARSTRITAALDALRKVPSLLWLVITGVFAAVYLAFFVLQAGYLFGAFSRTLPEGYTVAEYARQGFFSLCRVMAVNFALLWLVTRSGERRADAHLPTRVACTVLLGESLIFAVIAASKLALYIDCFGFTPRRLQSAWLIAVLAVGCGCALYTLWTRRKSARLWIVFTGVSLALLHLV